VRLGPGLGSVDCGVEGEARLEAEKRQRLETKAEGEARLALVTKELEA